MSLCMPCILRCTREEAEAIERNKQRDLNQKRADYRILAEEIVRVLMRGDTA